MSELITRSQPVSASGDLTVTREEIAALQKQNRRDNIGRAFYKFSRNPLSIIGGATVLFIVLVAIFAECRGSSCG